MKGHEAGMDRDGDCGKVKVIEEHRQMIVKSLRGREVQLQRPTKRKANETSSNLQDGTRKAKVIDLLLDLWEKSERIFYLFLMRMIFGIILSLLQFNGNVIVIIGNEYGFIRIQKEKRKIKRRAHSESSKFF